MFTCVKCVPSEMNIMLLGSTGSGKSTLGNTILNRATNPFKEDFSPDSVTRFCQSAQTEVDEPKITVIDTVGLSDTGVRITDAQTQIEQMIKLHNIDVFLLVIKLGETFRKNDSKVVKWIKENLGEKAFNHTMVLFTHGDLIQEPIEMYLNKCKELRSVVDLCSGGFHVFNNKTDTYTCQVAELLNKINTLRMRNRHGTYTWWYCGKNQERRLQRKSLKGAGLGVLGGAAFGGLLALAGFAGEAIAVKIGIALTAGSAAVIGAFAGAALAAVSAIFDTRLIIKKYSDRYMKKYEKVHVHTT